jgi:hypothetical protein
MTLPYRILQFRRQQTPCLMKDDLLLRFVMSAESLDDPGQPPATARTPLCKICTGLPSNEMTFPESGTFGIRSQSRQLTVISARVALSSIWEKC